MAENIYKELAEGGGFNLPYLLHIYDPNNNVELYVINDNEDLSYGGHTYKSSNFKYVPKYDGDTTLDIELVDSDNIIDILDSNYYFNVDAIGVLHNGEIIEINQFHNWQGEGTWTGKSLQLKLKKDDRLDMTFPALIFNSYNNRGNS